MITTTKRYKCEDFLWEFTLQEKTIMSDHLKNILLTHFIKYEEYEKCSEVLKYYQNNSQNISSCQEK